MLPPEYLESLPEEILKLYAEAEQAILADMARRIGTYDYWIPAADWQNQKLLEAGRLQSDILKVLSKATGKSVPELKKLMEQASEDGLRVDKTIYEEAGLSVPPFSDSEALRAVLNAGYKATAQTMENLTRTTARTATRQFERALDKAWMKVQSGAFSTDIAVRDAVKELAGGGVKSIRYPSGHEDTLEVAVRRAVVTGVNQTHGKLQVELAEELNCDLMELTAHAGARTGEGAANHAGWQGKIVSLSGRDGYLSLEDIGYGTGEGFQGWNCRHGWNPYFEGMPRTWTEEELQKLNEPRYTYNGKRLTEYEAQQQQRYFERQIRRWKRENVAMDVAGLDTTESAVKIKQWQDRQTDFLKQTGLKRQQAREQIDGFGKSQARKATAAAGRARQPQLKNAAGESIIPVKHTTTTAKPNSITQYTNAKGGIDRNFFGDDGRQTRQISNHDHGHKKESTLGKHGEHAHDYTWDDSGNLHRGDARELTDDERRDNSDFL